MNRYIWSLHSQVYHEQPVAESCNTDDFKHRRSGDMPPKHKRHCKHCPVAGLYSSETARK